MKGGKFFSVPYDVYCSPEMRYLRRKCGGIAAFGRWMAFVAILYTQGGAIDLDNETMHKVIEDELELKPQQLDEFIEALSEIGWVDAQMWRTNKHAISGSVLEQLDFKKEMARRAGKQKQDAKANS